MREDQDRSNDTISSGTRVDMNNKSSVANGSHCNGKSNLRTVSSSPLLPQVGVERIYPQSRIPCSSAPGQTFETDSRIADSDWNLTMSTVTLQASLAVRTERNWERQAGVEEQYYDDLFAPSMDSRRTGRNFAISGSGTLSIHVVISVSSSPPPGAHAHGRSHGFGGGRTDALV